MARLSSTFHFAAGQARRRNGPTWPPRYVGRFSPLAPSQGVVTIAGHSGYPQPAKVGDKETVMDDALELDRHRPRVLVTGVERPLGANLALHLVERLPVVGCTSRNLVGRVALEILRWDAAQPASLLACVRKAAPQWIVHCGGIAQASWDLPEAHPEATQETAICRELASIASELDARLTVVSSDAVFAGPRLFADEATEPSGRRQLAIAARQVEQALVATDALVVRTHAYGWSPTPLEPSLAERVWQTLAEGGLGRFDVQRHATPILASDLANLLWRAYRRKLAGLWHLAGAERVNQYRFAWELARVFGFSGGVLPLEESDGPEPGELESSLSARRAQRELDRPMPTLREGLERFAQQHRNGTRARLQALGRAAEPGSRAA